MYTRHVDHSQIYAKWWQVLLNVAHKLAGEAHLEIPPGQVTAFIQTMIEDVLNYLNVTGVALAASSFKIEK